MALSFFGSQIEVSDPKAEDYQVLEFHLGMENEPDSPRVEEVSGKLVTEVEFLEIVMSRAFLGKLFLKALQHLNVNPLSDKKLYQSRILVDD